MRPTTEHLAVDPPARRAGLLLLGVLALGLGLNQALIHPLHNYLLDFRGYYAAGLALRAGVNPYDTDAVRAHFPLPGRQPITVYIYPPPTLPLVHALSFVPYPAAQVPWCLLQYTLLLVSLALVLRTIGGALGAPLSVLIAGAFLLSTPVEQLFRWGQFDMIVLVLLAAACLALVRGRTAWAGVFLGLATVAKVTPGLYLGVLLVRREFRALLAALLTILVTSGAAAAVFGVDVYRHWVIGLTAFGSEPGTLASPENMSLLAYVYRALVNYPFATGPSVPWIDLGPRAAQLATFILLGTVYGITAWWLVRNRRTLSTVESIGVAIPVALLTSSVTWTHHGVQLLIPLALLVSAVVRSPRARRLDLVWIVAILLLYLNWPVERFELGLAARLAHVVGPTFTYAVLLTWLFMVTRYGTVDRLHTGSTSARRRPAILMVGPAAPQIGGMVTAIDLLLRSPLREQFALHRFATTTASGRSWPRSVARHLAALGRLAWVLVARRIDLVHVHTCSRFTFYRSLLDLALAKLLGRAVVLHIRGGQFDDFCATAGRLSRRLIRRGAELADAVIVLSPLWQRKLRPHLGHARLYVIPNGVEVPDPTISGTNGPGPCRFVYLAALTAAKGLPDLLEAAALLRAALVPFELTVAGPATAEPQATWERRARRLELQEVARFIGPVSGSAKAELLASADCFVHPSHSEALPNAVLEAAAAGLPIIATSVGSVPEVLTAEDDEPLTPLVSARDPVALAREMRRLAGDASLRERIGSALRAHVAARFSLACTAKLIAGVYADTLGRPPERSRPTIERKSLGAAVGAHASALLEAGKP